MPARVNWTAILADWRLRLGAATVLLAWCMWWAWRVAKIVRPDLLRPTDIGSDVSNYLAAGQRLLAGHPLYALTVGDRPVPFWDPPAFTVPIISPPPMAVPWAILSLLPAGFSMSLWWAACFGVTVLVVVLVALRAPWPLVIASAPLGFGLAYLVLAGNLNSFILCAAVLLARVVPERPNSRLAIAGGALLGALSVCKLGPVLLVWWLLVTRAHRPFAAAIVAAAVLLLVPLAAGGLSVYGQFLAVARDTSQSGATGLSVEGFLLSLNVPAALAKDAGIAVPFATALGVLLLRGHPRAGFAVAMVGMVWATPVVRYETIALLIGVTAMWWDEPLTGLIPGWPQRSRGLPVRATMTSISIAAAVVVSVVAFVLVLHADRSSSLRIVNNSSRPVVAQLGQRGPTLGFLVQPGATGIAWGRTSGRFQGTLTVLDADTCTPLAPTRKMPVNGGEVAVGADNRVSVAPDHGLPGAGDLPFVSTCGQPLR